MRQPEAPMGWPEHHRPAAHVDLLGVEPEQLVVGDRDHREGLVDLPEVDVPRPQLAELAASVFLMASAGAMVNSSGLRAA
jgi:hypothetical protein